MANVKKTCIYKDCNRVFDTTDYLLSINKGKFCSKICCDKSKIGKKHSYEHRLNQSKGSAWKGKKRPPFSQEWKDNLSKSHKGLWSGEKNYFYGKKFIGSLNPKWKLDRSTLAQKQLRNDSAYKEWRMSVYTRDKFKCAMSCEECSGKIEAHHILRWSEYPELRYSVQNGITLCTKHHPKKKKDEEQLSPYFQNIITNLN